MVDFFDVLLTVHLSIILAIYLYICIYRIVF